MWASALPPNGNVGSFGYDAAWLEAILPPNPDSPRDARPGVEKFFTVNIDRLLDASYGITKLTVLQQAQTRLRTVAEARGPVADRLRDAVDGRSGEPTLVEEQRKFYDGGHSNYTLGPPGVTNYRGFPQDQYDRVLTWAAYAVMFNQAASTHALTSWALSDPGSSRSVLRETSGWAAYAAAYIWGHFNPAYDGTKSMEEVLPVFTRSC